MNLSLPLFSRGVRTGALGVLALLVGCGGDLESETVALAGLADRALTYSLTDADLFEGVEPAGSHRFTVTFSLAEDGRCTRLAEGVTATFNGEPMRLEVGGVDGTAGRDVCVPTRAFLDFDPNVWGEQPVEDARVVLQDASHTVSLVLQGGKAKRYFSFESAGEADRLTRGQSYSYRWQPDGEVPGPVTATLLREGGTAAATLPITQDAGLVTLTVPASTPVASHLLTLSGSAPGTVLECTGVASCGGTLFHSEEVVVAVQ
ncbi:hypothetical protein [Myxococcus sp. RHSTA-1-4]|uniref:hypothetical protein n=1 Tax=Myxococcus sp. RHSTA-1-4 TaxID=2874601 RepID=UPI001CC12598|nr:hypothetical protein [Myxococcus sp. RHSTA-1-4]MBZ4415217.1 hypothetical protein [Myxococcus sp. RHSTA-1-4]